MDSLLKQVNRLSSKGMLNIYLVVTIEKKWRTQNIDVQNLKSLSPGQFLGSSKACRYYWIFKFFFAS